MAEPYDKDARLRARCDRAENAVARLLELCAQRHGNDTVTVGQVRAAIAGKK